MHQEETLLASVHAWDQTSLVGTQSPFACPGLLPFARVPAAVVDAPGSYQEACVCLLCSFQGFASRKRRRMGGGSLSLNGRTAQALPRFPFPKSSRRAGIVVANNHRQATGGNSRTAEGSSHRSSHVSGNGKRKGSSHRQVTGGDNGPGHESVGHAAYQQHVMLAASRVCGWFRVDGSDGLRLFARKEANSPCGEADTTTHERLWIDVCP
jgi:hypothetical protein